MFAVAYIPVYFTLPKNSCPIYGLNQQKFKIYIHRKKYLLYNYYILQHNSPILCELSKNLQTACQKYYNAVYYMCPV